MSRKRTVGFTVLGLAVIGLLIFIVDEGCEMAFKAVNEIGDRLFARDGDGPGFDEPEEEESAPVAQIA